MQIVPDGKPKISISLALKILRYIFGVNLPEFAIIGIRGYYANLFGAKNANDINVYDDAIIVIGKGLIYEFNANCDPSMLVKAGVPKAILKKGLHYFKLDYHHKYENSKRYVALRPATKDEIVPVWRTGANGRLISSTGQAINIHQGGLSGTWSEGCQTIYHTQYADFITLVGRFLGYQVPLGIRRVADKRLPLGKIPYVLIDFRDMEYVQNLPELSFFSAADAAYRAQNFVGLNQTQPAAPKLAFLPDHVISVISTAHDADVPGADEQSGFADLHAGGDADINFNFQSDSNPDAASFSPAVFQSSDNSPLIPENSPINPPKKENEAANSNEPDCPGDVPEDEPKTCLSVEDWKPWVFSMLRKIWSAFFGGNFTQTCAWGFAAFKSGEYWYLPLVLAGLIVAATFVFCAFVSLIVLAIWYFNRKEIVHFKTLETESRLDPDKSNLKLEIEKIKKSGFFGLKKVFHS